MNRVSGRKRIREGKAGNRMISMRHREKEIGGSLIVIRVQDLVRMNGMKNGGVMGE